MKHLMALILVFGLNVTPYAHAAADTLENPTDDQIVSLYHYLAGTPPDFEAAVRNSFDYRNANEFDRPALLERLTAEARARFQANAQVDTILLRTASRFGEWNADLGAYQIALFEPGVFFPFGPGRQYGLTMENAEDFRNWTLPLDHARLMRERMPSGRMVFEVSIRPFGIAETREKRIRGQIIAVTGFNQSDNQQMFHIAIDEEEYRPIQAGGAAVDVQPLGYEQLSLQGITLDMDRAAVEDWLADRDYVFEIVNRGQGGEIRFGSNAQSINYHNSDGNLRATGNTNYDPLSASIFGKDLDCRAVDDALHTCGFVRLSPEDGSLQSVVVLQQALGATREQIVSSLTQKYGSALDQMEVTVLDGFYRGRQYVWGSSATFDDGLRQRFTNVTGPRHWQVEAAIVEPDTTRIAVIVQINAVTPEPGASAQAGGQIEF